MLTSFNDLIRFRARLGDEGYAISDLLFNVPGGRMKYLVVDTGAWLESQQTLVAASLVGDIDTETGEVLLDATPDQFADAPRWHGDDDALGPILSALPPLVVGPFGSTYAPLAMVSEMSGMQSDQPEMQNDPRAEAAIERFEPARSWLQAEIFGRDGELGTLGDLLLDTRSGRVTHLVVDNGSVLRGKLLVVPFEMLRHRATGGHLVLDITAQTLESAPQIDQIERLDRTWQENLHNYYMVPI